jgi:DNA topoisomerase I
VTTLEHSPEAPPADGPGKANGTSLAARRAARSANLTYVAADSAGFYRRGRPARFFYVAESGRVIRSARQLARIRALAIPPAWKEVWISSNPNGHLQATGRDARGRKQYRYHARWQSVRDHAKYQDLIEFAERLPRLRRVIARDLARPTLDKRKVLAVVVALIEKTHARIGNDRYRVENGSFGLTTLQDRHARKRGERLELRFRAKGGKFTQVAIDDARLARVVRRCRDIPGQRLFQYLDAAGKAHAISSTDVNDYIRDATGAEFTAKTFRTWAGSFAAARLLANCAPCRSNREIQRTLARVLEGVAEELGNTPAICRKSYVHPGILAAFSAGSWSRLWRLARRTRARRGLLRDEAVMIALFESLRPHLRAA